ncbi:MAG: carbamoyl-phosphate synthase large subunit [Armatimonadetes bacterium]|nr:carbamoyl-phosphate synthase large subunit [Armatimonadota bacterium]NOG38238.1 carbamoyl-phosphate synthase large subunit [Armatimonadota bacterium]GIK32762.1 MAG: carbamoyl-phosphate synthase large chain, C-terminal section [Armatimonadota bacterium]
MPQKVLVLGSGPIRIGQGIEFDYSCVHCAWALQDMGYEAILLNNNPETVSTDFDTGDALYFEPGTLEDVLDVYRRESPIGVAVQFGGQTAINLAQGLHDRGLNILGTSAEAIALAEDRDQFERLLRRLGIPKPLGRAVRSLSEALEVAEEIGFPVLVRPSFVLGGRAMEIVFDAEQLRRFYRIAEDESPGQPVLIDKYMQGIEAEVDVISDGEATLVPGVMEHIERAGVHSGDSMAVFPPVNLSDRVISRMVAAACDLAREIGVRGLMNIQFVVAPAEGSAGEAVPQILEVNPRGSRTVPFLAKVTGIPMVDLATRAMMGQSLSELGYESGLWRLDARGRLHGAVPEVQSKSRGTVLSEAEIARLSDGSADTRSLFSGAPFYAVKAPVFSFQKLARVEPSLGPEMKSTGEIMGIDSTFEGALYKSLVASGISLPTGGVVVISVNDADKPAAIEIAKSLSARGHEIACTGGTHRSLQAAGVASQRVAKISEGSPHLLDLVMSRRVSLLINTPGTDAETEAEASRIRRGCIETGVACITNIDTAEALVKALPFFEDPSGVSCLRLDEYFGR